MATLSRSQADQWSAAAAPPVSAVLLLLVWLLLERPRDPEAHTAGP